MEGTVTATGMAMDMAMEDMDTEDNHLKIYSLQCCQIFMNASYLDNFVGSVSVRLKGIIAATILDAIVLLYKLIVTRFLLDIKLLCN